MLLIIMAFLRGLRNYVSSSVVDKHEAPVVLNFSGEGFTGVKKVAYLLQRSTTGSVPQNEGKRIREALFISKQL